MSLAQIQVDWEYIAYGDKPHERAFGYLTGLRADGEVLMIDIGANSGISALSTHFVQPAWKILSIEANPMLEPLLQRTAAFIAERGGHMEYRILGLSDVDQPDNVFRIPVVDKVYSEVLTMGTFASDQLDNAFTSKYLSKHFSTTGQWDGKTREMRLPLCRFDGLTIPNADHYFVKVDVDGLERRVVAGMMEFVRRERPGILIEIVHKVTLRFLKRSLGPLGYRPYTYDGHLLEKDGLQRQLRRLRLARMMGPWGRARYDARIQEILDREMYNVFYLPDDSPFVLGSA